MQRLMAYMGYKIVIFQQNVSEERKRRSNED